MHARRCEWALACMITGKGRGWGGGKRAGCPGVGAGVTDALKVEIWSDVVCPWCYIGKRRLEAAVASSGVPVEVTWRSFQLDPTAPRESTEDVATYLGRKYGGGREAGLAMNERVSQVAAQDGLDYHLDQAQRANTVDAHRLLHLAGEHGLQDALKERLLRAYFTEGQAVGDAEVLAALADEVGLPAERVRAVLGLGRVRRRRRGRPGRGAGAGGERRAVLRHRPAVRRERRAAGGALRAGAAPGLGRQTTHAGERPRHGRHGRRGVRPGRLRALIGTGSWCWAPQQVP